MVLNGGKALLTDDMLDPAGVLRGSLSADAQGFQPLGQDPMALIDHFRDLFSRGSQGNVTVFVHADMAAVAEILHGHADAGLGKSQLIGDIDGTDIWLIQTEDQDGLQIIFC